MHHEYPILGLIEVGERFAGIHQRTPRSALWLRTHWAPSPCDRLSRPRTTTGPPSHPAGISRQRAFPERSGWLPERTGTNRMVPTFPLEPLDGVGAQLCPCNLAVATPQAFTTASRPTQMTGRGVPHTDEPHRCASQRSPDLSGSSCWIS